MKTEITGNGDMFTFEGSIPSREQARAATPVHPCEIVTIPIASGPGCTKCPTFKSPWQELIFVKSFRGKPQQVKPQDNLSLLHEGDALEHDGFDSEARPESEQDSHI